ncbi:hypothetical protein NDU88_006184 [Pleurodeles waltl]|uniref:Uncharacterized protein n=1 Tax=Pleurodeles waltl TaxID=8319 RepID=A0AAV7UKB5_PLEWA|nr:hypothetical protein NDU88_006184 [Pleurodeles waltl]
MGLTGPHSPLLRWVTSSISGARAGGAHLCFCSRAGFSLHCSSETLLRSTQRQRNAPRLRSNSEPYWLVPADHPSGHVSQARALLWCVVHQPGSPFTAAGSVPIQYFCHHFRITTEITGFSVTLPSRALLAPPIMSPITFALSDVHFGVGWCIYCSDSFFQPSALLDIFGMCSPLPNVRAGHSLRHARHSTARPEWDSPVRIRHSSTGSHRESPALAQAALTSVSTVGLA